ncbi:MAG: hypothetical protein V4649_06385 [Bacteroidota bacterium]
MKALIGILLSAALSVGYSVDAEAQSRYSNKMNGSKVNCACKKNAECVCTAKRTTLNNNVGNIGMMKTGTYGGYKRTPLLPVVTPHHGAFNNGPWDNRNLIDRRDHMRSNGLWEKTNFDNYQDPLKR